MVPKDPIMLLSYLNTNLRDYYPTLRALCEELQLNEDEIVEKMKGIDYIYNEEQNQFR